MRAKDVRIIPLDVGTLEWDQGECTLRRGFGKKVKAPFIAFYIEGLEKKVLIDTGPRNQERSQRFHKALNPIISPEQEMPQRLRQIGLKPDDIEILVLTHLHWDHVGHADKLANARIFVSREEFNYAMAPLPPLRAGYENLLPGVEPVFLPVLHQFEYLEMREEEIIPGLKVFPTPGHTTGCISVEVETGNGPYIVSGDAVYSYDHLRGDPAQNLPFLMMGIYVDFAAVWKSYESIFRRARFDLDRVVPGHDFEVLKRKSFP
jgi:glyoxylase-like metal-dependent hydrolase (beta-lactamase superfamily II)